MIPAALSLPLLLGACSRLLQYFKITGFVPESPIFSDLHFFRLLVLWNSSLLHSTETRTVFPTIRASTSPVTSHIPLVFRDNVFSYARQLARFGACGVEVHSRKLLQTQQNYVQLNGQHEQLINSTEISFRKSTSITVNCIDGDWKIWFEISWTNVGQEGSELIGRKSYPHKSALIALFSAEIRATCC